MRYFTNVTEAGTVMGGDNDAVGVYAAPDSFPPIGMALPTSDDRTKPERWRIVLKQGGELPGRWVLIDREFRPAQ